MTDLTNSVRATYGAPRPAPTPAVFLDRDGVIVEETNYLHRIEDLFVLPGVVEAIAELNNAQVPVVVVTNQAGVARGYYGWLEYETLQAELQRRLGEARWDGVWACGEINEHPYRKPNPGMLLEAAEKLNLDLARSWLVGDKTIDIQAAVRAGLAGAILVRTGYGASMESEVRSLTSTPTVIEVCDDLAAAVALLLEERRL